MISSVGSSSAFLFSDVCYNAVRVSQSIYLPMFIKQFFDVLRSCKAFLFAPLECDRPQLDNVHP